MAEGTKERILRTALELFAQNGYLGTSMNDIAGQLGFTKAALYKHYASNIIHRRPKIAVLRKQLQCYPQNPFLCTLCHNYLLYQSNHSVTPL